MTPKTTSMFGSAPSYTHHKGSRFQSLSDGEGWLDQDDRYGNDTEEDEESLDLFAATTKDLRTGVSSSSAHRNGRRTRSSSSSKSRKSDSGKRSSSSKRSNKLSKSLPPIDSASALPSDLVRAETTSGATSRHRTSRSRSSSKKKHSSSTTSSSNSVNLGAPIKTKETRLSDMLSVGGLGSNSFNGLGAMSGDRSVMSMPATSSLTPSEMALQRLHEKNNPSSLRRSSKERVSTGQHGTSLSAFFSKNKADDDSDEALNENDPDEESDDQTFHSMFHWSVVSDGEGFANANRKKKKALSSARSVGGWSMTGRSRGGGGGRSVSGTKSVGTFSKEKRLTAAQVRKAAKDELDQNFDDFLRARYDYSGGGGAAAGAGAYSDDGTRSVGTKSLDTTGFTDGEDDFTQQGQGDTGSPGSGKRHRSSRKKSDKKKSSKKDRKSSGRKKSSSSNHRDDDATNYDGDEATAALDCSEKNELALSSKKKKKSSSKRSSSKSRNNTGGTADEGMYDTDERPQERRQRRHHKRKDEEGATKSKRRSSKAERRSSKTKTKSRSSKSKKKSSTKPSTKDSAGAGAGAGAADPISRSSRRNSRYDDATTDDDGDKSEFDSVWEGATNYDESESFTSGDEGM